LFRRRGNRRARGQVAGKREGGCTNYADKTQRHAGNLESILGMRVTYISKESFSGSDTFGEFFFRFIDVVWKYTVTVK
jgi:hypothetical protein